MDELLTGIIKKGLELKASDIHLRHSREPLYRIDGIIQSLGGHILLDEDLGRFFNELLDSKLQSQFKLLNDLDFAKCLSLNTSNVRTRVNAFLSQRHLGFVIRLIN